MALEILRGHEAYMMEYYIPKPVPPAPPPPSLIAKAAFQREMDRFKARNAAAMASNDIKELILEAKQKFSDLYSNKHEKLLLRTEHIETMERIRNYFNKNRSYYGQEPITVSDFVNCALDFIFQHPIHFHRLEKVEELKEMIARDVYKIAVSRFKQFHELF